MVRNLKIGHLNVRSIFTGFDELKNIVLFYDFDVFFMSETWLSEGDDSNLFNIPNYRFLRRDRRGRGGGVGVFIKSAYFFEPIDLNININPQLEHLIFKMKLRNKIYAFLVFYKPPMLNFNNIKDDFDSIFSSIYPTVDEIFCMGDFNINLLNVSNPLTTFFENYNLVQVINEPTRISSTACTLIDAIFVTNSDIVLKSGVISADNISDHKAVFCDVNLSKAPTISKIIRYRCFRNFNYVEFLSAMYTLPWNNLLREQNIDTKIEIFNNFLLILFNTYAPIKESRITKQRAPWLTSNIKLFMKQRDAALHKFKKTKLYEDWLEYKYLRNFTLAQVRKEKKTYLDSICAEKNPRKIWKAIRSFNISHKETISIPNPLSDPYTINNFFAKFLQNKSTCNDKINFYYNHFFNSNLIFKFRLAEVSDVNKIINNIKTNAIGVDEISPQMLKYCSPFIDKYITHIINCCIELNYFPDLWKTSIGKPLPKISNPTNFNEIRIISILPAISKIFERILYDQMYVYFINNNIIPTTQCGFRKNFGTSVALTNVTDDIIRAYDNKMNSLLVLLDFSKAFDTINHSLLISKLSYYGFENESSLLMQSYLKGRKQKILSNSTYSNCIEIFSGVPQGSILGPLLFLVYTSDILKSINYCKVQAFADDIQLYYCFNKEEYVDAEFKVNHDLNLIYTLSMSHNLVLNPSKSYVLLFANKNNKYFLENKINICINNDKLNFVSSAKNLGITMDTNLRFKEHLKKIFQKTYYSLKMLYSNRHILNTNLRRNLCESLVLSNFTYCDFVYGFCLDVESKNRIQVVQNACVRFVYNIKKSEHVSQYYKKINWLKMDARRNLHFCSFLIKNLNTPGSPSSICERLIFRNNIHNCNIRNNKMLTMPHHRSAMFQRGFSYNAVKYYNSLPTGFCQLNNLHFKIKYKKYLLSLNN